MNALAIITTILQLVPALITAMKAIEEAIPGQGNGEKKLAAVRGIMEAGYEQTNVIWPALEKTISVLVAAFNASGVFKR